MAADLAREKSVHGEERPDAEFEQRSAQRRAAEREGVGQTERQADQADAQ